MEKCKAELKKLAAPYETPESEHLDDLRAIAPAMRGLLRLTASFAQRYQAEKVRRNALDFSDQEHYALTLLAHEDGSPTELGGAGVPPLPGGDGGRVSGHQRGAELHLPCRVRRWAAAVRRGRREAEHLSLPAGRAGDIPGEIPHVRRCGRTASEGQPRRMVLSRNFRSRREVLDVTNFVFGAILSTEMGEMDYTDQEKLYFGAEYYAPAGRDVELHLVSVEDTEEERFDRAQAEARFGPAHSRPAERGLSCTGRGWPADAARHAGGHRHPHAFAQLAAVCVLRGAGAGGHPL